MGNSSAPGSWHSLAPQLPMYCVKYFLPYGGCPHRHSSNYFNEVITGVLPKARPAIELWSHTHISTHTYTRPLALSPVVILTQAILTMLVTSGEAPFCSRRRTMFKWPMKAATCIGVRPDCETKRQQFYSSAPVGALGLLQINKTRRGQKMGGRKGKKE